MILPKVHRKETMLRLFHQSQVVNIILNVRIGKIDGRCVQKKTVTYSTQTVDAGLLAIPHDN